ncbi:MAG: hypothetical protein AB7O52_10920 [Planctomycetota bacterium]
MHHVTTRATRAARVARNALLCLLAALPAVANAQSPDYWLRAADTAGVQGEVVAVEISLEVSGQDVQGWSFGLCHDAADLQVAGIQIGPDIATINNGGPPFFSFVEILADGVRVMQILDFAVSNVLHPDFAPYQILVVSYELLAPNQSTTTVGFCNTLGNPATSVEVVVRGQAVLPTTMPSTIDIGGGAVENFVRGDCNDSGSASLPDAVFLLGFLFPIDLDGDGSPDPSLLPCRRACDANDDGSLSIPDVIALLASLFGAPPVPLSPPTNCGPDPTPDALTCDQANCP